LTYSFHFISSLNGRKAKGKCRHNLYFALQEQHTVSRYVGVNSFWEFLCLQILFTDEKALFIEETNLPNTSISLLQSEILSITVRLGAGEDKERGR